MFDIKKYNEIKGFLEKKSNFCQIIAVSKNHPKTSVIKAINSGVLIFGENRVMEAKEKFEEIKTTYPNLELHLTGPLQSNKVKIAVNIFDVFHTLDREKIAVEFSKYREILKNKKIFIQVNTGQEPTKSGVIPKDLKNFSKYCVDDLGLKIVGLMCIPPINEKPSEHFELLQSLATQNKLKELSIGMSSDYIDALDYNPSYIRIGTAFFGKR